MVEKVNNDIEHFRWQTVSSWIDETFELFSFIDDDFELEEINKKVKKGEIFSERKISSATRVYSALKTRYLNVERDKIMALAHILNSSLSKQEKYNTLMIYYLEHETLLQYFLEDYIYQRFSNNTQKIFTQMDLDKFFEIVFNEKIEYLSKKLQVEVSDASMKKVRNQLFKYFEDFNWGSKKDEKIYIKRPSLTSEWFVFTIYYYFQEEPVNLIDIYRSTVYKRFLLTEYDIEFLLTGAKIKGLVEIQSLGDINIINKKEKGLLDYAKSIK